MTTAVAVAVAVAVFAMRGCIPTLVSVLMFATSPGWHALPVALSVGVACSRVQVNGSHFEAVV